VLLWNLEVRSWRYSMSVIDLRLPGCVIYLVARDDGVVLLLGLTRDNSNLANVK
jgi:hypothetical protein